MASRIVGLDIGSTALRAVEVSRSRGSRPTVHRYLEIPLPAGAVSHGEVSDPAVVTACLKKLWSTGGFKSTTVVLGLGNQRVVVREFSVPSAPLKVIRESLPFQVQDMLPVPVAEVQLDFYPAADEAGADRPTTSGLLIAARKDAALGNIEAVRNAGLRTVEVDLIPFALTRVQVGRDGGGGTAIVDVGANTTSVIIAQDGVPQFVRLIPAGGQNLTDALAMGLGIAAGAAEDLKRTLGLATPDEMPEHDRPAVETLREVTVELLDSIRNTVDYFRKTRPHEAVNRLVLTGGGAKLHGFAEALGEMTRLEVVANDPFAGLGLAKELKGPGSGQDRSSFIVALGLAIGDRGTVAAEGNGEPKAPRLGKAARKTARGTADTADQPDTVEKPEKAGKPVKADKAASVPAGLRTWPRKGQVLAAGGERSVDLLPGEIRRLVVAKKARDRLALAVVASLVLVLLGSGAANLAALKAQDDLDAEQAETAALLAEQAKYREVRQVQAEVARVQAARRTGAGPEIDWKAYLDAVQKTLPGNVTIATVNIDSSTPVAAYSQPTAPLQGARVATLNFSARSPTLPAVPDWLDNLQTLPGFADALPNSVTTSDGGYTVNITMHINDGAFSKRFAAQEK